MKKLLYIVGTRPQFIKLAPLYHELKNDYFNLIVNTGQHYDKNMSFQFWEELRIKKPEYNFSIAANSLHGAQTAAMILNLAIVIQDEKPDAVIVFGDTNSTLAGAITTVKMNVKLIHIEAGLRSFNKEMPEEINRIITDSISDLLFAPTDNAIMNLKKEGLGNKAFLVGDIMVDSLKLGINLSSKVERNNKDYYLLTLHRPSNVDDKNTLVNIMNEIGKLANSVIFPIHPRTQNKIKLFGISIPENILVLPPLGFIEMIGLIKNSKAVITDSGGVQKETYIIGKQCFTLRTETEWIETLKYEWNILIDPKKNNFYRQITNTQFKNEQPPEIFGNNVSKNIHKILDELL